MPSSGASGKARSSGSSRSSAPLAVTGKLHRKRFLSVEEFTYAQGHTDRVLKVTLPSPSLFANFWSPEAGNGAYEASRTSSPT